MPVTSRGTHFHHLESVAERLDELQALHDDGAALDVLEPELRAAERRLLGERTPLIRHLDARTATHLMPHDGVARVWTRLLRLEAAACRGAGLAPIADRIESRAAAIDEQVEFARGRRLRGVHHVEEGGDFVGSTAGVSLGDFRVLTPHAAVFYGLGGIFLWRPRLGLATVVLLLLRLVDDAAGEWRRARRCAHGRHEACDGRARARTYLLRGGGWLLVAVAAALTALRVQPAAIAGAALAGAAVLLAAGFWRSPPMPCAGDAARPSGPAGMAEARTPPDCSSPAPAA